MIRMGVSVWMFLLVPAYPGSPGSKAIKRLCVCVLQENLTPTIWYYHNKWHNHLVKTYYAICTSMLKQQQHNNQTTLSHSLFYHKATLALQQF